MSLGRQGEALAAHYLAAQGYQLLGRNVRVHPAEMDLVCMDRQELVVVEVKTRTGPAWPEEAVTPKKQATLFRAASLYAELHNLVHLPLRFDVVAIRIWPGRDPEIQHYTDAFRQNLTP
ncbi:MAG: YraN family protein [Bacteroidetes bacterium]|jgi:putative endonuclease|nr:YraN family protein [Bacteroidota bacterium]